MEVSLDQLTQIDQLMNLTDLPQREVEGYIFSGFSTREALEMIELAKQHDLKLFKFKEVGSSVGKSTVLPVRYIDPTLPRLLNVHGDSDWVDASVSSVEVNGEKMPFDGTIVRYKAGDAVLVNLGFALMPAPGTEGDMRPRSSTFRRTGLLMTGSGVMDESYSGNDDEWKAEFYATRPGYIRRYQRIVQFRFNQKQFDRVFYEVESLPGPNRGGFGSTGY